MNLSDAPSCSGRGRGQGTSLSSPRQHCHLSHGGRRHGWFVQRRSSIVLVGSLAGNNGGGYRRRDDDDHSELPTRYELSQRPDKQKPTVRVKLSVHYRVHSRQILCIGGSQIPLGWSFLSIAKVPMTWTPGDVWTCEASWWFATHLARDGPR